VQITPIHNVYTAYDDNIDIYPVINVLPSKYSINLVIYYISIYWQYYLLYSNLLFFHVTRDIREEKRQGRLGYRPFSYTHEDKSFVMSTIILRLTQRK
jgi:hypothetical protein